jgi:diacylglycerol O-acyltransferase / wax synthase
MGNRPNPTPLTAADSAWLRMEDATNLMTVTAVMMFQERLDLDRLRGLVEDRLLVHDRFRQKVVETRGRRGKPHWEDVDDFRLADHLHATRLAEPADEGVLQEFVGEVMSTPLDYTKPLWHFYYVENYGDASALVARLHHCMGDGVALVRLLLSLTSDDPHAAAEDHPPPQGGVVRRAGLFSMARAAGGAVATLGKLAGIMLVADPKTALKGPLGARKRAIWSARIPLDEVKRAGRALGGTVNDVLLTAVSGALRHYLRRHQEVGRNMNLRAVVPVNIRPLDEPMALGNKFGLVFLTLPVGMEHRVARLRELKRRMDRIKQSGEAAVVYGILRLLGVTTAALEMTIVNLLGRNSTAVMTNVPGPRSHLYLGGTRIDDMIFWVPQSGRLALGVSILSYAGGIRIGVAADRKVITAPDDLMHGLHDAIEELLRDGVGGPTDDRMTK